jgi:predicted dehydrogenase
VVGGGSMGRRHLRNLRELRPDAELAVLRRPAPDRTDADVPGGTGSTGVDTSGGTGADTSGSAGPGAAPRVFTDLHAAAAWAPEVAVVANPAPWHVATATTLLDAGAAVLIEKPLSDGLAGIDELVAARDRSGRPVVVGYCLRFDPCLGALRDAVASGGIGTPHAVRCEVGSHLAGWRPGVALTDTVTARPDLGGGAVLELSHELDLAYLLGGPVARVQATVTSTGALGVPVDDLAEIVLSHRGGIVSSVHLDLLARPARRRTAVWGDDGIVEWDLLAGTVTRQPAGAVDPEVLHRRPPGFDRLYVDEMEHLLACAAGEATPRCTLEEARDIVELCVLARDGGGHVGVSVDGAVA